MEYTTKRQELDILRAQLKLEQATFLPHWRDLSDFVSPRRARFYTSDVNRGDKRNKNIIDSTATLALRTLRSGMMSGVTSPARPWFRLTTPDPDLAEVGPVKQWLDDVSDRMNTSFLRSNLYNILPITYGDMGTFATSAMMVEEDFEDVLRFYSFPIGSYMISCDAKGKVNVFMREFRMTIRQLIEKFAWDNETKKINWEVLSQSVKSAYESKNYEQWVDVVHVIKPNPNWDDKKLLSKYKRYESCYYESGMIGNTGYNMTQTNEMGKFLSEKGYDYFPVLCPRWEVTGEDVYGTDCPAMTALGDIRQLQLGEKRIAQASDKMINPAMVGPTALRNQKASILPGDITYVDIREGLQGFRAAHDVQFRIDFAENKQAQVRQRIQRAFYEDLFLMLANDNRSNITATEISERKEEKLLALGPVLEQLNQDLLDPLIDISFDMHLKQGYIPPPPDELQGMKLKVEYVSVMAQAQKLVGISGIERFFGFVGQVAQFKPEVTQKINGDQAVDTYADMVSIKPGIIYTDDEVAQIRSDAQAAQQQAVQSEQLANAAASAKNLSQANLEGDNALTRLMDQSQAGT